MFNTAVDQRERVSAPVSWRDLLSPPFRGRVVMPDARRSGTGYMLVAGWLQSMGEAAGRTFMDTLDANVTAYLPSGSASCEAAARGEALVGLSFDLCGVIAQTCGDPVRVVAPIDGIGWGEEAFAILTHALHEDLARKVADWATSREANRLYTEFHRVVAHPAVQPGATRYPSFAEARMIRTDLSRVASNRERVLNEWGRRYAAKAVQKASRAAGADRQAQCQSRSMPVANSASGSSSRHPRRWPISRLTRAQCPASAA